MLEFGFVNTAIHRFWKNRNFLCVQVEETENKSILKA
jgi:tRNA(Met) C34 N-acetyltransferase TmcA